MTVRRVIAHHVSIAVKTLLLPTCCSIVIPGCLASGQAQGQYAEYEDFPYFRICHFKAPFPNSSDVLRECHGRDEWIPVSKSIRIIQASALHSWLGSDPNPQPSLATTETIGTGELHINDQVSRFALNIESFAPPPLQP
jgi:hypothetical protein